MNTSIKLCIDVARAFNEQYGRKDQRFYKQDWLARTLGIYRTPNYPITNILESNTSVIEALWKRYKPIERDALMNAALLASWLVILYPDSAPLARDITDHYNRLIVSHAVARCKADAGGYQLNITAPFDVIARDIEDLGIGNFVHIEDLEDDQL